MDKPVDPPVFAWQPFTARGVAAFGGATFGRVWIVQLVFALVAGAIVAWVLAEAWFPTIRKAIRQLPAQGEIRAGHLSWPADSPMRLAENRFLALAVDLHHEGLARSPAHLQAEFGADEVRLISLFGTWHKSYPQGYLIAFNQPELEPWFGAWAPAILAIAVGSVVAALFACWTLLASLYFLPAWLLGFFANRNLTFGGAWRVSGAALMPGCLLLSTALFFYGLSLLDIVHLLVATALHFVLGWVYVVVAVLVLPRHPAVPNPRINPFVPSEKSESN